VSFRKDTNHCNRHCTHPFRAYKYPNDSINKAFIPFNLCLLLQGRHVKGIDTHADGHMIQDLPLPGYFVGQIFTLERKKFISNLEFVEICQNKP
jgi:hypothetical protein